MIKFLLRAVSNPHGALSKAIIKLISHHFKHVTKYVEEDNELDVKLRKMETESESLKHLVLELAKDFHSHENDHAKH